MEDFRARLNQHRGRVWVRTLTDTTAVPHVLLYAAVTIGPAPPEWAEKIWMYDSCTFAGFPMSVAELRALFTPRGAKSARARERLGLAELLTGNITWQHNSSRARPDHTTLIWPTIAYETSLVTTSSPQAMNGFLVGPADTPSFAVFGAAFGAFFRGDFSLTGAQNPPLHKLRVHIVDTRARIARVRVRAASVEVTIAGRSRVGLQLERTCSRQSPSGRRGDEYRPGFVPATGRFANGRLVVAEARRPLDRLPRAHQLGWCA